MLGRLHQVQIELNTVPDKDLHSRLEDKLIYLGKLLFLSIVQKLQKFFFSAKDWFYIIKNVIHYPEVLPRVC